jgi:hypothetical protein
MENLEASTIAPHKSKTVQEAEQWGEFLETYGGWGISVVLGLWLVAMFLMHRRERGQIIKSFKEQAKEADNIRRAERDESIKTFQEYHKELTGLVSKSTSAQNSMSEGLKDLYQLLAIKFGMKIEEDIVKSLSNFRRADDED